MAKMSGGKAAKMGFKSKTVGGADDGSRKSVKHQVSGNLKANSSKGIRGSREGRIARMEARNVKC